MTGTTRTRSLGNGPLPDDRGEGRAADPRRDLIEEAGHVEFTHTMSRTHRKLKRRSGGLLRGLNLRMLAPIDANPRGDDDGGGI